ncbi:hypothetical protein PTKIN_Ptkin08bG0176800 [Pterospermum kingtungense]
MDSLPVWVQLSNIPLELFHQKGIGCIASAIGKPLYTDRITAQQLKLSYARVCVEIGVLDSIPKEIEVVLKSGKIVKVQVYVPWLPAKCLNCHIFGHGENNCPKNVVGKQWIPKKKEIVNNKVSSVLNCEEKDIDKTKIGEASTSKVDPDLIDSIRCDSDKNVAANVSNGKMLGKAYSVHRYALLQSPIDSKSEGQLGLQNNEAGKGGVSSVAALMAGIKAQVAEEIQARQESQAKVSTEDNKKNMAIVVTEEEDDVSEDSFDEFDGLVQKTKKGLPAIGMLRTPRLAAAGVAEAVKAVKARNKKCRRQAKKASASKK